MIKDKKEIETISVYDPTLGAYHEISLEDAIKQMESLGLDKGTIKKQLEKYLQEKKEKLKSFGSIEDLKKYE